MVYCVSVCVNGDVVLVGYCCCCRRRHCFTRFVFAWQFSIIANYHHPTDALFTSIHTTLIHVILIFASSSTFQTASSCVAKSMSALCERVLDRDTNRTFSLAFKLYLNGFYLLSFYQLDTTSSFFKLKCRSLCVCVECVHTIYLYLNRPLWEKTPILSHMQMRMLTAQMKTHFNRQYTSHRRSFLCPFAFRIRESNFICVHIQIWPTTISLAHTLLSKLKTEMKNWIVERHT